MVSAQVYAPRYWSHGFWQTQQLLLTCSQPPAVRPAPISNHHNDGGGKAQHGGTARRQRRFGCHEGATHILRQIFLCFLLGDLHATASQS